METNNKTMAESALEILKGYILNCEFKPGDEINEKNLIEKLNMGRTPIREALLELQKENYLTIVPRKSIIINPINQQDINELYQLRKLIEPQIIMQNKAHYDASILSNYIDSFQTLNKEDFDVKAFHALDIEFHLYLISISNNAVLIDFYKKLMESLYRVGIYNNMIQTSNAPVDTVHEHRAIVEAILKEDDDSISETVLNHINNSLLASLQRFNEQ